MKTDKAILAALCLVLVVVITSAWWWPVFGSATPIGDPNAGLWTWVLWASVVLAFEWAAIRVLWEVMRPLSEDEWKDAFRIVEGRHKRRNLVEPTDQRPRRRIKGTSCVPKAEDIEGLLSKRNLIETCRMAYRHELDNAALPGGAKRLTDNDELELGRRLAAIWEATSDDLAH